MQAAKPNALLRALLSCVEILHKHGTPPPAKGTAPPPLNDHMARDIGLTDGQVARLKHEWPSQSMQHPYL